MSDSPLPELWARFVAGEALLPEEEQRLLEELRRDPSLAGDAEVDGLLRALQTDRPGEDAFVKSVLDCLEAERDVDLFVEDVAAKLQPRPPATRRATRRVTRRLTERRIPAAAESPRPTLLGWVTVAAAALLLIGMLGYLRYGGSPVAPEPQTARPPAPPAPDAPVRIEREEPKPVVPPAPAPTPTPAPESPTPAPSPRTPAPAPKPQEPVPATPAPAPKPTEQVAPPQTAIAAATIEKIEGDVVVAGVPAKAGDRLPPGTAFETVGARSSAVLRFDDRTKLDVAGDTLLKTVAEGEAKPPRGKLVEIAKGSVTAEVSKQPLGQLMLFTTPHGEAQVVGTILRIQVNGVTRVEVKEGRVRLRRKNEGRTADVTAGLAGVLATGREITVRPAAADRRLLLSYDFEAPGAQKDWERGVIDRAFTFGGSKGALKAAAYPDEHYAVHATSAYAPAAYPFPLTDRTMLSFAFYVSAPPGELKVQLRSYRSGSKPTIGYIVPDVKVKEWTVVTVRMAEVFRVKAGTGELVRTPVTEIDDLQFHAGTKGPAPDLYLDSIEIFE